MQDHRECDEDFVERELKADARVRPDAGYARFFTRSWRPDGLRVKVSETFNS